MMLDWPTVVILLPSKQNICRPFVQRRPNVFDVGPTLYKCYTTVLCLLRTTEYVDVPHVDLLVIGGGYLLQSMWIGGWWGSVRLMVQRLVRLHSNCRCIGCIAGFNIIKRRWRKFIRKRWEWALCRRVAWMRLSGDIPPVHRIRSSYVGLMLGQRNIKLAYDERFSPHVG